MRSIRAVLLVATAMTGVAACGGSDFATGSGRPSGRTYGPETWYEAQPGSSPDEVVVRFEGPEAGGDDDCVPERGALVVPRETGVEITVQRFAPSPVIRCSTSVQSMTVPLPEPLGQRALVNPQTGWRFSAAGDRFALDPDSTPCGRADCSAVPPDLTKASCNPLEFKAVVDEQLRPAEAGDTNIRCDGAFLVLTRDGRNAWFVNRDASWKLVTRDHRGCDDVWRMARIRFPAAVCG
jgi:hypothetical protein